MTGSGSLPPLLTFLPKGIALWTGVRQQKAGRPFALHSPTSFPQGWEHQMSWPLLRRGRGAGVSGGAEGPGLAKEERGGAGERGDGTELTFQNHHLGSRPSKAPCTCRLTGSAYSLLIHLDILILSSLCPWVCLLSATPVSSSPKLEQLSCPLKPSSVVWR